jgi:hypothetical protein
MSPSEKAAKDICDKIKMIEGMQNDALILDELDLIAAEVKSLCGNDFTSIGTALDNLANQMVNRPSSILKKITSIKLSMAKMSNKECKDGHSQAFKF